MGVTGESQPSMAGLIGYGAKARYAMDVIPEPASLRDQLEKRKAMFTAEIEKIDKALTVLNEIPRVEEMLDLLGSIGLR